MDSDEEWANLVELTDQELKREKELTNGTSGREDSTLELLITDPEFLKKVNATFDSTAGDVINGVLEGASKFRQVLKVFQNILLSPR